MKKGIILVKDIMIVDIVVKLFPEWNVLLSNCEKGIEFYPNPITLS